MARLSTAREKRGSARGRFGFGRLGRRILRSGSGLDGQRGVVFRVDGRRKLSGRRVTLGLNVSRRSIEGRLDDTLGMLERRLVEVNFSFTLFFVDR